MIFTAGIKEYANAVIDSFDTKHIIKRRFYRDSCMAHPSGRIKDLAIVNQDISKTVIIDNS